MLEFQEKRKVRKFMYSRITIAILLIITFFVLKGVWGVYQKQQITHENLEKTIADFNNLKNREETLSKEIDWLKTQGGIEEEIREKYGLIKPGEEVITIIDSDVNIAPIYLPESDNFWQKFWLWLQ